MIKSKYFWVAAILLAIVPLLVIDIVEHRLSLEKEVREELIYVAHDVYHLDQDQKAQILDKAFERNEALNFLIYTKSFLCLIFLVLSFYLFRLYRLREKSLVKPVLFSLLLFVLFATAKFSSASLLTIDSKRKFLDIDESEASLQKLIQDNFKNKVVYVDFWGTSCGPCLEQFRNFTKPLKEKYPTDTGLIYLYIANGNKYLWQRQIEKYDVDGIHVFLNHERYNAIYRNSIENDSAEVYMPRYLIFDRSGQIVSANAWQPSDFDSLSVQLEKYLD